MTPHQVFTIIASSVSISVENLYTVRATTPDSDYISLSSSTLVFPDGSNNGDIQCIDIVITDDEILERNEVFTVSLNAVTQNVMAVNAMTAVTIIDDDG